jgi:hypothetical protein
MGSELDSLEGEVHEARRRVKSDLEILRTPGTVESFKAELVAEARQSADDAVANVTAAARTWSERLVSEIKERAAANPVAVGAIAAGLGWRILRKPPITTMLVGYGIYSLFRTKPGELAPGAETVYQAADTAVAAKEQVQRWGKEAAEALGEARAVVVPAITDTAHRWRADAGEAITEAAASVEALVARGSESIGHLSEDVRPALTRAAGAARSFATNGAEQIHDVAFDKQERDKVLLGAAAATLAIAVGLAWFRRS